MRSEFAKSKKNSKQANQAKVFLILPTVKSRSKRLENRFFGKGEYQNLCFPENRLYDPLNCV